MPKDLTVDQWWDEIVRAQEYRRKHGMEDFWAELEELFYHSHISSNNGPNIVAATGDALVSTLSVPNPRIKVSATQGGQTAAARTTEGLDNELVLEMGLPHEVERANLHAFLWGRGIIKIGYDSEWGYDPEEGEFAQLGLSLSQFDKKGNRIEFDARTTPGMPWVRAVPPHDILVPWGTCDLDDAPWIAHRVVRHIDAVKADPKYSKTRMLQPVMSMQDYVRSYQTVQAPYRSGTTMPMGSMGSSILGRNGTGPAEFVELYEIHDKRTGQVIVLATGHQSFLRKEDDALQFGGALPFRSLCFVPNARTFWVTPDAMYLRHSQAELADIAVQATKQRRLSVLKLFYAADALDEDELLKATSIDVGMGVQVKGGQPLRDAVMPATPNNNNQMLYADAEVIRRDARETVGFSRNQLGEFETRGRRTASEARLVQQGSALRMNRRQLQVKRLYEGVITTTNEIIFRYWRSPRWTEVLGAKGDPAFVQFLGSELRGKYRYRVEFSSEPMETLQQRKFEALQLYGTLAQDPMVDPVALRNYFTNAFNDPEMGQIFRTGAQNANVPVQVPGVQSRGGAAPVATPAV